MTQLDGRPYWTLSYDENGQLQTPRSNDLLRQIATSGVRELFVLSHGWNTGQESADRLYEALGPLIRHAASGVASLGPVGFVGIHWPAIWFPDPPTRTSPGARAGSAQSTDSGTDEANSTGDAHLSGREVAADLREGFTDPARRDDADLLGQLIDDGLAAVARGTEPESHQLARLGEFQRTLRRIVEAGDPLTAPEDSGEVDVFTTSTPAESYMHLADVSGTAHAGGSSQDIGDFFAKAWEGAKNALRATSYYVMKARAGRVGSAGLGPLLENLHDADAAVRVHLVGHSFGARLVAFALAGIPAAKDSPVRSLTLIQAAFSHFSFAHLQDNPFESAGALRSVIDRVHGPLVSTHSRHDWALSRWYPKASALARQDNQAKPAISRWGALGAGGFQAVTPLESRNLLPPNTDYNLTAQRFYSVDASARISDWSQSGFAGAHSDIRHPEIAWLAASAAAAGADSSPGPA